MLVFVHGESFEWGAGHPYDGSVLASYGHVIVVTLNFRLGILGKLFSICKLSYPPQSSWKKKIIGANEQKVYAKLLDINLCDNNGVFR